MNNKDLHILFSSKTDEELLSIVAMDRGSYTPEAIQIAESVLASRSIAFDKPEVQNQPARAPEEAKPFMPFVIGIAFVAMAFYTPTSSVLDADAVFAVNITLNLIIRFVVVMWLVDLVKRFDLKQVLWIILGLLFGGWALMVANIVIWIDSSEDTHSYDESQNTSGVAEGQSETLEGHGFTECPACQFKLGGLEDKCPDCGLSLIEKE